MIDYKKAQQAHSRKQKETVLLEGRRVVEGKKLVEPVSRFQEVAEAQEAARSSDYPR